MSLNINQSEILIDRMMDYYLVVTYSELAIKINTTQQTISSWKQRNSVNAIKKKCKELGIYDEIFGDINSKVNNLQNSEFNSSIGVNNGDNTNINSKSDDLTECDDFTKSLFRELCKVYKDKTKLHSKLFELIQNA
jgi:hypothetical protein